MHQRTTRVLALGGLAALTLSLTACGPAIGGDGDQPADSSKLQAPTEASPKGEITIWDREGDLFKVFDEAIEAIRSQPALFPLCDNLHRFVSLKRYPYSLIYRWDGHVARVIAVAHAKRRPGPWSDRD